MKRHFSSYLVNLLFPVLLFGGVTGVLTAVAVTGFRYAANFVIAISDTVYTHLRDKPILILLSIVVIFAAAFLFSRIYRKAPYLSGGGIPAVIGILRGVLSFNWWKNLIGTVFLSLFSFFLAVPLGNEGPSVMIGTAIGKAAVTPVSGKHGAWSRYAMTGGACSGFAVATGAPMSGILFAVEEAHQKISPMIISCASVSVLFSLLTTQILSDLFGIKTNLFPSFSLPALSVQQVWIPLAVGIAVGLFAVFFLVCFRFLERFFVQAFRKISSFWKIAFVLLLTLMFGMISAHFVSTGHNLMHLLFENRLPIFFLILLILVRMILTLSANVNGITGGMFVPLLAIGATVGALLFELMSRLSWLREEYMTLVIVLSITACVAGMMKMPLTSILFAVEALGCFHNLLSVILVAAVSYLITELFRCKSINDMALENRKERETNDSEGNSREVILTVQANSFAVGKQIRDILWPSNCFVLSLQHNPENGFHVDGHGGKEIFEGDVLHIRFLCDSSRSAQDELIAIVGEQEMISVSKIENA